MAVWIVALILLAGAGLIVWLRRSSTATPPPHKAQTPHPRDRDPMRQRLRHRPQLERLYLDGRYWGVRIEPGMDDACDMALSNADSRYSFDKAPFLPLPECAATRCSCCFVGLDEQRKPPPRRQNSDRREKIRYEPKRGSRRQDKDRRKPNNQWDAQNRL